MNDLAASTLAQAHASWFPGCSASLLRQAASTRYGRRWMQCQLMRASALPSRYLFRPQVAQITSVLVANEVWITQDAPALRALALRAGAALFAEQIRTSLDRAEVLQIRAALGAELYEWVLRLPRAFIVAGERFDFTRDASHERLIACGYRELGWQLLPAAALVERLMLLAPRGTFAEPATHIHLSPSLCNLLGLHSGTQTRRAA